MVTSPETLLSYRPLELFPDLPTPPAVTAFCDLISRGDKPGDNVLAIQANIDINSVPWPEIFGSFSLPPNLEKFTYVSLKPVESLIDRKVIGFLPSDTLSQIITPGPHPVDSMPNTYVSQYRYSHTKHVYDASVVRPLLVIENLLMQNMLMWPSAQQAFWDELDHSDNQKRIVYIEGHGTARLPEWSFSESIFSTKNYFYRVAYQMDKLGLSHPFRPEQLIQQNRIPVADVLANYVSKFPDAAVFLINCCNRLHERLHVNLPFPVFYLNGINDRKSRLPENSVLLLKNGVNTEFLP